MRVRVADASVLAAMLFQEPRAEEAHTLLEGAELYEPTLLPYELASIARKKIVRYPEQREALLESLELGLQMDVRWVEVDHAAVVIMALDRGLSTYDAAYLYVADLIRGPLVTFDARLGAISP